MTGRGSWAWLLYLLAGIAATGGYFLLPSSSAQNIFIILVDASVVAAITAGTLMHSTEPSAALVPFCLRCGVYPRRRHRLGYL